MSGLAFLALYLGGGLLVGLALRMMGPRPPVRR